MPEGLTWLRIVVLVVGCVGLWAVLQPPAAAAPHHRAVEHLGRPTAGPTAEAERPTAGPAASVAPAAPLVGVCVVGGARTVTATWDPLWVNGIDSLQPDPARRRVIVETTFSIADCDSNPMNAGGVAHHCRQEMQASVDLLNSSAVADHPTRRFDLHVDDALTNCSHPFVAKHECCKNATAGAERMADPPLGVWGLRQYLRKAQCSDRLRRIEQETGVPFDVIAWVRPDLYLFERFPPATEIVRMQHPRVLLGSKEGGSPIGDYIFIAPRPLKWAWHYALLDALGTDGCSKARGGSAPENRLDAFVRDARIPLQIYPFLYAIARSNRSADCFRLKNEVLYKTAVADSESHELLSPHDLCKRRFPE
jgi:hypothetical protein